MTVFDAAYIIGFGLLVGFELWAVFDKTDHTKGQTISHKVVAWMQANPTKRRIFVGVGLAWLFYHWVFQPF